jgi:alpha-mannosidase
MLTLRSRDVVLSSLRRHPEKGYLEVRLYNPTDKSAAAECEFAFEPASSALTDFEGHSSQPCKLHGKTVSVTLAPKRIVTLAVSPP